VPDMYEHILLLVDLGNESSWKKALPTEIDYCSALGPTLHGMTVMPDFGSPTVAQFFPNGYEDKMMTNANGVLHKFVAHRVPDTINVQHIITNGTI